ncbi:MAG: GGDEF domain-containing protein, partial [Oscillospiraceae bacterium]|nr:GGDEF domain-containing protein [Oscillospiraceae bacterium]
MIKGKKIIALCIPKINEDSSRKFITALNNSLPSEDCRLMVYATCSELFWNTPMESGESAIYDLLDFETADIIVIFVEKIKNKQVIDEIISKAAAHGKPIITVDGIHKGTISTVFDYEAGFRSVVEHVVDIHKTRDLHMMAGIKGNDFSEQRVKVFADVLKSRDIPFDRDTMVSYGDFWAEPAKAATNRLIAEHRVPKAIVCANDAMALAVTDTLISGGYKIPEDVIVTGFDGIDDIKLSVPKITSCICSFDKIAKKISEIIGKCLNNSFVGEDIFRIPATLILSESCGCNKEKPLNAQRELFELSSRFCRYQDEEYSMYELVTQAISCTSIEELSGIISDSKFYDVDCALTPECFDETVSPLSVIERENAYGNEMIDFFSSDEIRYTSYRPFPRKDIFPRLEELLEFKKPLFFFGLNFLNVPLGYVCFHFHNDDSANYCKVPQVIRALNNAIGGYRNLRYHHYLQNRVEEIYKLDNLTGLYNRNGFNKEFERIVKQARENGGVVSAALVDLDGLKAINDTYGHDEGDNAIKTAADAFKTCCPENAVCVRFGGDEMMAVYHGK